MARIEVGDVFTKEADDRGRIYLSTDIAHQKLTIEVVKLHDDADEETGNE